MAARRQAQTQAPGVQHEHGGGRSQGPAHGQGIGVGLYLLTVGGGPPGRTAGPVIATPPSLRDAVKTAAGTGTGGQSPQSYVVTLPTYSAGDLVILHVLWNSGSLGVPATPSGWTRPQVAVQSGAGSSVKTSVFTRVMAGNEGSTVTVSEASFSQAGFSAAASSWRPVNQAGPIPSANGASSGGSLTGTWTGGAVTIPATGCLVATVVTAQTSTDFVPTNPATLAYDFLDSSGVIFGTSYRFGLATYQPAALGSNAASGTLVGGDVCHWGGIGLALQGV